MLSFMIKAMLPKVAEHAEKEYEQDQKKTYHGVKKELKMRDGSNCECLFFPTLRKNAPLLIDVYGGGYIGGNCYKQIELCERYRQVLDINTAAISYRYGPSFKHPQAMQDAYDSICALFRDKTLNFDRNAIILEGHSAGSHLITSVALYNQVQENLPILAMILDYPLFDLRLKELRKLPKMKYAMNSMVMEMMYYGYLENETCAEDTYASQILASDSQIKKLPPMLINTCEYDSLRFSAETFAKRLEKAGADYLLEQTRGAVHGYVEQCANDTMRSLKDYPQELKLKQYDLYNDTFRRFCDFVKEMAQKNNSDKSQICI